MTAITLTANLEDWSGKQRDVTVYPLMNCEQEFELHGNRFVAINTTPMPEGTDRYDWEVWKVYEADDKTRDYALTTVTRFRTDAKFESNVGTELDCLSRDDENYILAAAKILAMTY